MMAVANEGEKKSLKKSCNRGKKCLASFAHQISSSIIPTVVVVFRIKRARNMVEFARNVLQVDT